MIKFILTDGTIVEITNGENTKEPMGLVSRKEVAEAARTLTVWRKQTGRTEPKVKLGRKEGQCIICENPLPPKKGKYCSPACYKKGQRRTAREYQRRKRLKIY